MFRPLSLATVIAISLTVSAPSVRAGDSTPLIDTRQDRQKDRITDGAKSGALTGKEARKFVRGQKRIRKMEENTAADGVVTKGERRRIRRAQKRQSANIFRKKHNRRHR